MNKGLRSKRERLLPSLILIGVTFVCAFTYVPTAWGDGELVVKLYACPQGQASAVADTLRNEFGVISGVRVAADERTARVIIQAPAEVQSRISRRMAAAFPDLQPLPEKAATGPVEVRLVALKRIQADQLETALWSALGSRLTALPEQLVSSRGYRLAMSGPGAVTLWIDLSANQVKLEGPAAALDAAVRLIQILDAPPDARGRHVRLMPLQPAQLAGVQRAASIMRTASGPPVAMPLAALLLQPRPAEPAAGAAAPSAASPSAATAVPAPGGARPGEKPADIGTLSRIINPVQMEVIEGLDVLVLRGSPQDVQQMMEVVRQIERISQETEPSIEILAMQHVESEAMATLVKALYDEVYLARQGAVSITPLAIPNAILIVGRPENVLRVKELVARLDQPAVPGAQFRVFHLRYATAAMAQATIQNAFADHGGLSPAVHVSANPRTTSLIVQASPRDMAEVAELIRQINVSGSDAVNEVRIIRLEHTLAQDIATIMQSAIGSATTAAGQGGANQPGQPGQPGGPGGPGGQPFATGGQPQGQGQNLPGGARQNEQRNAMLRFLMVDAKGRRLLNSGILTDVRITADVRANALVISSPPENLDLLEGLVRQLDNLPAAEAQIKVFTIVNGDASALSDMLKTLFTGQATGTAAGPQTLMQLLQNTSAGSETSLVPLRFGVDTRTNSVIASGTMADLNIVEAILTKLDDGEIRHRRSVVIRLKNSPAQNVADAINTFLTTEQQRLQQAGPGLTSAFEQIEREVVVVPELVTNSLLLSATPKYFEEIRGVVEQLDARPPMVMIQVLIASVELGSTNEFGIELGLQDSVLFDRSILSSPVVTTNTLASGASATTVISASQAPGFTFNNGNDLGNSAPGFGSNISPSAVGSQGISNFGTGRTNSTLGYSGLVLSAASENVSAMLRALSENHRVDILQRPQIMTLDNQPAIINVGQQVPYITNVSTNALTGNSNAVQFHTVGLILGVTPRISPDGLVVMQIDAENSKLESEATGIPIYTSPTGQVIRSPIIDATTAQTTVSAMSGQTVVLGGLITSNETKEHHGVPVLEEIPVINNFFRYDSTIKEKTELLIIMTPHIVKNQADAEALKRAEAAKMTWCLNDVTRIYGEAGLRRRCDEWSDGEVPVIYPDGGPRPVDKQPAGPEAVPTPSGEPSGNAKPAPRLMPPPEAPVVPQSARYGTQPQPPVPGVQPANYQPQPWQSSGTAQAVDYQAPVANQPARAEPIPSFNYQPQPANEPAPPAYYPQNNR